MLEPWENFYLLVGSAAGALIGLLFVVTTLTTNMDRARAEQGQSLYMTPVVYHLAFVLTLSALAMAPPITTFVFGTTVSAGALLGLAWSIRIAALMHKADKQMVPHWSDPWCYGICPALAYVLLGAGGVLLALAKLPGISLIGGATVILLIISIRNAWDLVTWLAPRKGTHPDPEKQE